MQTRAGQFQPVLTIIKHIIKQCVLMNIKSVYIINKLFCVHTLVCDIAKKISSWLTDLFKLLILLSKRMAFDHDKWAGLFIPFIRIA